MSLLGHYIGLAIGLAIAARLIRMAIDVARKERS